MLLSRQINLNSKTHFTISQKKNHSISHIIKKENLWITMIDYIMKGYGINILSLFIWWKDFFINRSGRPFCATVIPTLLHLVVHCDIQGKIVQLFTGSFCTGDVELTLSLLLEVPPPTGKTFDIRFYFIKLSCIMLMFCPNEQLSVKREWWDKTYFMLI